MIRKFQFCKKVRLIQICILSQDIDETISNRFYLEIYDDFFKCTFAPPKCSWTTLISPARSEEKSRRITRDWLIGKNRFSNHPACFGKYFMWTAVSQEKHEGNLIQCKKFSKILGLKTDVLLVFGLCAHVTFIHFLERFHKKKYHGLSLTTWRKLFETCWITSEWKNRGKY